MKLHTISQSQIDGDLHLLQLFKCPINILYGSISKNSSILRYLPRHYSQNLDGFNNDNFQNNQVDSEYQKSLKKQKLIEKEIVFKKDILKDLNQNKSEQNYLFNSCCEDGHVSYQNQNDQINQQQPNQSKIIQLEGDEKILSENYLMKKIDNEIYFTEKFPVRMDLKQINIIDVCEIDFVLVSTYQELYGLPYLILERSCKQFKGKIIMTQSLSQIGKSLLIEFVKMCEDRNKNSIDCYTYYQKNGSFNLSNSWSQAQGQGGNQQDEPQKYNKGQSRDWIQQDQLFEICQNIGVQEWQDLYTIQDVENLFENYVIQINFNEKLMLDNQKIVQVEAVSSGVSIGQCNWVINYKGEELMQRIGLLTNICLDGEYRYPLGIDSKSMQDMDVLIANSNIIIHSSVMNTSFIEGQQIKESYSSQIFSFLDKLNTILNSSFNAKVLVPIQPTFILEIVDLLLHKINENVRIVVLSESAQSVIEYSNINVEYLNKKLQEKIYMTESPLSFDKLIQAGRLKIYSCLQEYKDKLLSGRQNIEMNQINSNVIQNEQVRELFLCSHESLRIGDSPLILEYLNNLKKQQANYQCNKLQNQNVPEFSLILTDPLLGNSNFENNLLLRPFQNFNQVNVIHLPFTTTIGSYDSSHLVQFFQILKPKKILFDQKMFEIIEKDILGVDFLQKSSYDIIKANQSIYLELRNEYMSSFYTGTIPTDFSQEIKMQQLNESNSKNFDTIGKLGNLKFNFKDQKIDIFPQNIQSQNLFIIQSQKADLIERIFKKLQIETSLQILKESQKIIIKYDNFSLILEFEDRNQQGSYKLKIENKIDQNQLNTIKQFDIKQKKIFKDDILLQIFQILELLKDVHGIL